MQLKRISSMGEPSSPEQRELTPQDLNVQLRNIFSAIPPVHEHEGEGHPLRSIVDPIGSGWAEHIKSLARTAERRRSESYSAREILKRKLRDLLEHSPTTPSFQSYMVTLFDAIYTTYPVGRRSSAERQPISSHGPASYSEFTFSSLLNSGVSTSYDIFDPHKAYLAERYLYDQAAQRLAELKGQPEDLRGDIKEDEMMHVRNLLPQWQVEYAQLHPQEPALPQLPRLS